MSFITNTNLQNTRHDTMPFEGRWRDSLGRPAPFGSWLIYGTSGSGKTSFPLQVAKYLTRFSRIMYWSIEQGNSQAMKVAWMRENMDECGKNIMLADEDETFDSITKRMNQKWSGYGVLIVDSLTPLRAKRFNIESYESIRKQMKGKLLIWISHESKGNPDTSVGDYILKLADLKIRIEGFKAMINTRSGNSLCDFVIWEQGAIDYWMKKTN
ncbi:hypothetical protein FACS1894177_06360 [Bacteroidia bacterium]|nr:hypothetical protein FACS1894177_06360 [Bacteroidia bacterium]